jgi:hypothetical protein
MSKITITHPERGTRKVSQRTWDLLLQCNSTDGWQLARAEMPEAVQTHFQQTPPAKKPGKKAKL